VYNVVSVTKISCKDDSRKRVVVNDNVFKRREGKPKEIDHGYLSHCATSIYPNWPYFAMGNGY